MKKTFIAKIILLIGIICIALLFTPSVKATSLDATPENLLEVLNNAVDGDTIILADGTYTGNITIDKKITLKGTSKDATIIDGTIIVNNDLTVDNLTVQSSSSEVIDIKSTSDVKITNSVIKYKNYTENDYGNASYTTGVWLEKTADNSTLLVSNTEIYAKYGVWVYGQGNNVTIDNSKITGWSPVDISNGNTATTLAKSNSVIIKNNSVLTGVATLTGASNTYGTIVIGGQDSLELAIMDSTVQNAFKAQNVQDLILFGDAYMPSTNVQIGILSSKLVNTDTTDNSSIYNIGSAENAMPDAPNILMISSDTEISSANNIIYAKVDGYMTLTLSTIDGDVSINLPVGITLTEDILAPEEVEGYTFEGYFIDKDYKTPYDYETVLNTDTVIYAKYTENTKTPSDEEQKPGEDTDPEITPTPDQTPNQNQGSPNENIENPDTSDNIFSYIVLSMLSLVAICTTLKYYKNK